MADVKKIVEIAIQVTGIKKENIQGLADTFNKLNTNVKAANESVKALATSLNSIKIDPSIGKAVESLKQLKDIKAPDLNSVAKGFEKLSAIKNIPDLSSFVRELEKLKGVQVPAIASFASGIKQLLNLKIDTLAEKITKLNLSLSRLEKRGQLKSFASFASDINKMTPALNNATSSINKMQSSLKSVGDTAKNQLPPLRTLGDKIRQVFTYKSISSAMNAINNAIRVGLTSIVEYDQALKDLQAITGATAYEVGVMGEKIIEVASTTKFSASEVAEGMRTIGQAGFSASEAVETMQAVSDLATGTLSNMASTVDLVTTAMRVFRIDASQSGEVADTFANAVNRSKLTVDKLRTAMNYVGPIARDSGVSFKELSASMMTLANSGLRASTIGTGLRRVFAELIDPSKKLTEAANAVGVSLEDLDPRTAGFGEVIRNLGLVVNDASIAFDVFGKRGASAVLALSSSTGSFQSMLDTVGDTGTAARMASIQMEGLGVSFKNLKDKAGLLAVAIGESGLASAMKILIDTGRFAIDMLTILAGSTIGKVVIQVTALATAVGVLSFSFIKLNALLSTKLFIPLITSLTALKPLLLSTITNVNSLRVALLSFTGIGAVIITLIAIFNGLRDATLDAVNEAEHLSDSYDKASKRIDDYRTSTATMVAGSDELIQKSIALKTDLLDVASRLGEVSEEAIAAANSINPLTGEIQGQGEALRVYNEQLQNLRTQELVTAIKETTKFINDQTDATTHLKNGFLDLSENAFKGFSIEKKKKIYEILDFSEALNNNEISFKEFRDTVNSWKGETLNRQQKTITEGFERLVSTTRKAAQDLVKFGKIGLDQPIEDARDLVAGYGFVGHELDSVVEHLKILKLKNEETFTNIIEKWQTSADPTFLTNISEALKEHKGLQEKINLEELSNFEIRKQGFIDNLAGLTAVRDAEIAHTGDVEKAYRKWDSRKRTLLASASQLQKELNSSESVELSTKFAEQLKLYDDNLKKIAVMYKAGSKEIYSAQAEAYNNFLETIEELQKGVSVNPLTEEEEYKASLERRKVEHSKYLSQIQTDEAQGVITHKQAQNSKARAILDFYQKSYVNAKTYFDSLKDLDPSSDEYKDGLTILLNAEREYYGQRASYLKAYNSKVESYSKKESDLVGKVSEETLKHYSKVKKNREKLATDRVKAEKTSLKSIQKAEQTHSKKVEKIERDLANKIEDIKEDLADKIKDIDEDIAENKRELAADLLGIESDAEDKINAVKQRGMSDSEKDYDNRKRFSRKLLEGELLVSQANSQNDSAKLKRGQQLLSQAQDLATGFDSQTLAIRGIEDAEFALSKARNVEGYLKNLELIKKKKEETAEADKKILDEQEDASVALGIAEREHLTKLDYIKKEEADKFESMHNIHDKQEGLEDKRHAKVMEDLQMEIDKQLTFINEAKKILSKETGESESTKPGGETIKQDIQVTNDSAIEAEKELHQVKVDNANKEQIVATQTATIAKEATDAVIQSNKTAMSETTKQINEIAENGFREIEVNGVKTFTNLTDAERQANEAITESIRQNSEGVWEDMSSGAKGSLTEIRDEHGNLKAILGEGIEVLVGEVDLEQLEFAKKEAENEKIRLETELKIEADKEKAKIEDSIPEPAKIEATLGVEVTGQEKVDDLEQSIDNIPESKTSVVLAETDGESNVKDLHEEIDKVEDKEVEAKATTSGQDLVSTLKTSVTTLKDKLIDVIAKVKGQDKVKSLKDSIDNLHDKTINIKVKRTDSGTGKFTGIGTGATEFAEGGSVFRKLLSPFIRAGSGFKDDVPAMLMKGEYVIKKSAVDKIGLPLLEALNNMKIDPSKLGVPGFASGGYVGNFDSIKRKLELMFNPYSDYNSNGVNYSVGSSSLNDQINTRVGSINTGFGTSFADSMLSTYMTGVQKLADGGRPNSSYDQERHAVQRKYTREIADAQKNGNMELALVLAEEKEQLMHIANELEFTLKTLAVEMKQAIEDVQKEFEETKLDLDTDLSDDLGLLRKEKTELLEEFTFQKKKAEEDIMKLQADYDLAKDMSEGRHEKFIGVSNIIQGGHGVFLAEYMEREIAEEKAKRSLPKKKEELDAKKSDWGESKRDFEKEIRSLSDGAGITRDHEKSVERAIRDKDAYIVDIGQDHNESVADAKADALGDAKDVKADALEARQEINTETSETIKSIRKSLAEELKELEKKMKTGSGYDSLTGKPLGAIKKFAEGGHIPGEGSIDNIPALLMKGEYVLKKSAVKKYGLRLLDMINSGMLALPKFAKGGLVENLGNVNLPEMNIPNALTESVSKVVHEMTLNLGGKSYGPFEGDQMTMEGFINQMKLAQMRA